MESHKQLLDTSVSQSTNEIISARQASIIRHIIGYLAGSIMTVLAFRVFLTLLSADTGNAFVHVVYTVSNTCVWPFSMILQPFVSGQWHIDVAAIAAITFYGLIAWGVARVSRRFERAAAI